MSFAQRARGSRDEIAVRTAEQAQREIGYINHPTPTLITKNKMSDHSVYLIQPAAVRWVRQASAMETSNANNSIAPK
jgi:hypothetical protein